MAKVITPIYMYEVILGVKLCINPQAYKGLMAYLQNIIIKNSKFSALSKENSVGKFLYPFQNIDRFRRVGIRKVDRHIPSVVGYM